MNQVKNLLAKNPRLYTLAYTIYAEIRQRRRLKYFLHGSDAEKQWWSTYDWGLSARPEQVELYQPFPHRLFLLDLAARYAPKRILEVGCAFGPNLYLLAKLFPNAEITGTDINPVVIDQARELFKQHNIDNVTFTLNSLDDLAQFQANTFDMVITDAILIYVGPDIIHKVAAQLARIARQVIFIKEYHLFNSQNGIGVYQNGKWIRDYTALLSNFTPLQAQFTTHKFPSGLWPDKVWSEYGAVTECSLNKKGLS